MSDSYHKMLLEVLSSDECGYVNIKNLTEDNKKVIVDKLVDLMTCKTITMDELLYIQRQALAFIDLALNKGEVEKYEVNGKLNMGSLVSNCIDFACVALQCKL